MAHGEHLLQQANGLSIVSHKIHLEFSCLFYVINAKKVGCESMTGLIRKQPKKKLHQKRHHKLRG